jgi:protein-L-isoaspartate(D-aspartate) O-methyltransferase
MSRRFNLVDSYKHKGLRRQLAEMVRGKGIDDERIIAALEKVPRHFFLDSAFAEQAYMDKALQIDEGQTISQPFTVAYMTALLEIKTGDRVLEIGTGSGYQACILMELGAEVHTIERIKVLTDKAKELLKEMGYHPHFHVGDGTLGLPKQAPFDKIIVTAAAPELPDTLASQLCIGGILVVPVGDMETQIMYKVIRQSDTKFITRKLDAFRFVPLIGKEGWRGQQES